MLLSKRIHHIRKSGCWPAWSQYDGSNGSWMCGSSGGSSGVVALDLAVAVVAVVVVFVAVAVVVIVWPLWSF